MANRVRRGRAPFPSGHRAPTNWARTVNTSFVELAAGTKVLLSLVVLSNPGINETIRRTRGVISVRDDAQTSMIGAFGMVVVNDLAIAAGVASMPGPVTDASDDGWFVWQPFAVGEGIANTSHDFEFDSKAMRKIEEGFGVAIIAENAAATVSQIGFGFSMLTSLT